MKTLALIGSLCLAVVVSRGMGQESAFRAGLDAFRDGQYDKATTELEKATSATAPSAQQAQALFTLASIHGSQGRWKAAESVLDRLLAAHNESPWSIRGCDQAVAIAAGNGDWSRAVSLTARFIDLYLAWPYAAIDDTVCRGAYDRLIQFESKLTPSASSAQTLSALRNRYPLATGTGRVLAFFAAPGQDNGGVNLIINPGFELDAKAAALPAGWSHKGTPPRPHDDCDGTLAAGGLVKARGGQYCAGKFTHYGAHHGWLYQQVKVVQGQRYDVSAWGLTPAISEGKAGTLRLGVDPQGGTDPQAPGIRWTQPVSSKAEYSKLSLEGPGAVPAEGRRVTVFLEVRQDTPGPDNAMLFDDVELRPVNATGSGLPAHPPIEHRIQDQAWQLSSRSEKDSLKLAELLSEARRAEQAGDLIAAARMREQATALLVGDEERATQWMELVRLNKQIGRPLQAVESTRRALESLPACDSRHWPLVTALLTVCCSDLDRAGEAVAVLEPIVAGLAPGRGHAPAWFELARIRHNLGDTAFAEEIYEALLRALRNEGGSRIEQVIKYQSYCRDYVSGQPAYNRHLEADALIGRFQTRVGENRALDAGEVIAELLKRFPDAFFTHPGAEGVGARVVARELLQSMPPRIRQEYEAACKEKLSQLARRGRSEEIEQFVCTHPWPSLEGPGAIAAGDALIAEGRSARAAARYREALASVLDEPLKQLAQVKLARALTLLGEPLPENLPMTAPVTLAGRETTLVDAVAEWQKDVPARKSISPAPAPLSGWKHSRLRLQQAPLSLRKWQAGWQPGMRGHGPRATEAFVPYILVGDHDQVFVNTLETVYAIDPVNERLLWARNPGEFFMAEIMPPSLKQVPLVNSPKRSSVAVSHDAVFFRLNWASRTDNQPRSAVYAARKNDGTLLWSTETLAGIDNMRFVTDPACADGVVVAATWEASEVPVFHLVGLDAVTGEMLWRTHLFSGVMFPAFREHGFFDSPLGSAPPTICDGSVYFAPGMGVLGKVDLQDGHLVWLQTYPRVCEFGPEKWAGQFVFNRPSSPIIARSGLLLAAPIDQRGVLVFDADSGKLLRRHEAIDFRCMFGADDRFVFVQQGGDVAAIQIDDAAMAWRTTLPTTSIIGSPTLSQRGICCGTREGLFILSPKDGQITEHLRPATPEAVGTPLDLGDRVLVVSDSAVHVFAERVLDGQDWTTPRSPEAAPVAAGLRSPTGPARWALPAPDRGHLHVSPLAPDLILLQSWETFELRRIGPAPTLVWELAWLTWPRSIHFDSELFAMDYSGGQLLGVDMTSGKVRWELVDGAMAGERTDGGVIVAGKHAIWFNGNRVRVIDAKTGTGMGSRLFERETIRGFRPTEAGLGVFVGGASPAAVLMEWSTGKEIRRIPLAQPEPGKAHWIECARSREWGNPTVLPIVLLDGEKVLFVDLTTGKTESKLLDVPGATRLTCEKDVLCISGKNGLLAARSITDFSPLPVLATKTWQIRDQVQYCLQGPRVVAYDLATGKQIWQSKTLLGHIRHLVVTPKSVLTTVTEGRDESQWSRVVAINRSDGDVVAETQGLAGAFQVICEHAESLFVSDLGYVYRFGEPGTEAAEKIDVQQEHSDPEALAAVRLAVSMCSPRATMPSVRGFTPTVDGDLSEWQPAEWSELSWPDAWRPDHVLLAPGRVRRPNSTGDLKAEFAMSRSNQVTYLAIRVEDDIHDAVPWRPLWRGDSIYLTWRSSDQADNLSTGVAVAVVNGVPFVEYGLLTAPRYAGANVDPPNPWLAGLLAEGDVAWLRRRRADESVSPQIRAAANRDPLTRRTLYELAIPDTLLAGVAPAGKLLWDLAINDSDGKERKGALELGTELLQLRSPIGLAQWPTDAPAAGRDAKTQ